MTNNEDPFYSEVKFVLKGGQMPRRATDYSAGYDFYSPIDFTLKPGEKKIIDLGVCLISINFPPRYCMLLTIRSSLALKHNLAPIIPVAIIDQDYTDTIKFGLRNDGDEPYSIAKGDRICQGVLVQFFCITHEEPPLNSDRTGGVGSTGK